MLLLYRLNIYIYIYIYIYGSFNFSQYEYIEYVFNVFILGEINFSFFIFLHFSKGGSKVLLSLFGLTTAAVTGGTAFCLYDGPTRTLVQSSVPYSSCYLAVVEGGLAQLGIVSLPPRFCKLTDCGLIVCMAIVVQNNDIIPSKLRSALSIPPSPYIYITKNYCYRLILTS